MVEFFLENWMKVLGFGMALDALGIFLLVRWMRAIRGPVEMQEEWERPMSHEEVINRDGAYE